MTDIKNYLNDGANWQAQAVLCYLRGNELGYSNDYYDSENREYLAKIKVGRCENCREQGYVFTFTYKHQEIVHYWVYEHRNSDILCVKEFYGTYLNTPTINDIPMKDKYDYTKDFNYGEISQCGEWIIKSALSKLKIYIENMSSAENLED